MSGLKRIFTLINSSSWYKKRAEQDFSPTIPNEVRNAYDSQRPTGHGHTACSAPLKNMYFTRTGVVHACCHNRDYALGAYPENSIRDIWTGQKAQELRSRMACYNLSSGCQICQSEIERGEYAEVKARHFDLIPPAHPLPIMMEFELDITCNLECTMCSGEFSSLIRKNREGRSPHQSPYDSAFVKQLKPLLAELREARFSGGEPFLIPIYYQIWKELFEVNSECLVSVQTNGTVLNNKVKDILALGKFEIGVSLDSLTKETFETIRKGARFETVMDNIRFFSEYCSAKNTPFRLSMCVMRNNWQEMPAYVNHCNSLKAHASFHRVSTPLSQSLWNLKSSELFEIHAHLSRAQVEPADNQIAKDNLRHYRAYLELILEWANSQKLRESETERWESLEDDELIRSFKSFVISGLTDESDPFNARIPEVIDDLLSRLPRSCVRQVVLELKNQNKHLIIQRFRLKTTDEMVKELKSVYPDLFI